MSIRIEINDQTIQAPTSWEEVKVSHFINPEFLTMDSLGLISSLTGIDRRALMNSKDDVMDKVGKMVEFIALDPRGYAKAVMMETFTLRGVECKVPMDIEVERLGQKIMLQDAMGRNKFIYQAIPEAIAIYLIPQLNNDEFDEKLIPDLVEEVKELRIVDVFPIADFFLSSYRSMLKNGKALWNPYLTQMKQQQASGEQLQGIDLKSTESSQL